jgi:hypothetical protein
MEMNSPRASSGAWRRTPWLSMRRGSCEINRTATSMSKLIHMDWATGKGVNDEDGHLTVRSGDRSGASTESGGRWWWGKLWSARVARCRVAFCGGEVWSLVTSTPPPSLFHLDGVLGILMAFSAMLTIRGRGWAGVAVPYRRWWRMAGGNVRRLAMWVAVRDGCHSSVVAWASTTAASSVEDAMCIVGRRGRCLQRDVGWRAGGSLCGRGCLGVRRRAQW